MNFEGLGYIYYPLFSVVEILGILCYLQPVGKNDF